MDNTKTWVTLCGLLVLVGCGGDGAHHRGLGSGYRDDSERVLRPVLCARRPAACRGEWSLARR